MLVVREMVRVGGGEDGDYDLGDGERGDYSGGDGDDYDGDSVPKGFV